MRKNVRKRLAAFKVGLVLSIMITPFCFWKIAVPVHALNNVITYNSYGSFERRNDPLIFQDSSGTYRAAVSTVTGNLNGSYDGTVRIYYTIGTGLSISDFAVVPDNCFITYYSSSYMDIAFNGVSQWSISFTRVFSQGQPLSSLFSGLTIDSLTNWNMFYIGQSTDNMIKNMVGYIDDLEGYVGRCNASIIRCENLLTTIANNGGGGGGSSSTVNNIDINVDHIADDLNLLKTSSDDILSSLLDFFTDGLGQIITIESVLSAIDDTVNQLVTVNTSLTNIGTTLTNINTTLTSINSAVQNIDNSIDTITWKTENFDTTEYSIDNGQTWLTEDLNSGTYDSIIIRAKNPTENTIDKTSILKVSLPFYIYPSSSVVYDYNIIAYTQSDREDRQYRILYSKAFSGGIDIYIDYPWYSYYNNNYRYLNIKITLNNTSRDVRFRPAALFMPEYKSLSTNDIEYWTLMQYFNQYEYNQLILDAIESLNMSVTQTTVQDTITNVNNYNSTMNQVHNVENNYTNQFNTFNPVVQTELNTKLITPNGFIEGTNFIKRLFPRIIDNSSLVGFPFVLILAAVVLFVILG